MQKRSHAAMRFLGIVSLATIAFAGGCSHPMDLTTSPGSANVRVGDTLQFSAALNDVATTAVTWTATVGTISATGLYTSPSTVPTANTVTIEAVSSTNASLTASSVVTLQNPIPVVNSVSPTTIGVGPFTIIVTGSKFVAGAQVMFGATALATVVDSGTELTASGTATAAQAGNVTVTVQNPDPGAVTSTTSKIAQVVTGQTVSFAAATRFLEQSTFGPTPTAITQLQGTGFTPFLTDQFSSNVSTYPDPGATDIMNNNLVPTQRMLFTNALANPDQLRQRVALALSEIWVVSGNTIQVQGMTPYMRLLLQDAFANYRTIMGDITLSPAMGRYLDMVNNDKPSTTLSTHANENYARELMQLFTLGVYQLNEDGSIKNDSSGNPLPTYDQTTVQAMARVFTGWTYAPIPPAATVTHDPLNYASPMVAVDSNHDTASKTLLSVGGAATTLPAGQSSVVDLNGALDNIFAQTSLPPFVCKQLIQHLVSSNPSASYVKRVADAFVAGQFAGFGTGSRGDMQATIAAILLDPEARRGDVPATSVATDGHLREPILYAANLARAFGAASDGAALSNFASSVSEPPMRSPSVFNFFAPDYAIPGTSPVLLGPEFTLQTTATSLLRINFAYQFAFTTISGTTVDFTSYGNMACVPTGACPMLDSLNSLMLHGTMSASTRASILSALNAVPAGATQGLTRARTAIYLIASSSQYQVEY
jgi:uncharacterized protein (DUF1800 family)